MKDKYLDRMIIDHTKIKNKDVLIFWEKLKLLKIEVKSEGEKVWDNYKEITMVSLSMNMEMATEAEWQMKGLEEIKWPGVFGSHWRWSS